VRSTDPIAMQGTVIMCHLHFKNGTVLSVAVMRFRPHGESTHAVTTACTAAWKASIFNTIWIQNNRISGYNLCSPFSLKCFKLCRDANKNYAFISTQFILCIYVHNFCWHRFRLFTFAPSNIRASRHSHVCNYVLITGVRYWQIRFVYRFYE
jgi:hypothetical protein